MKIIYHPEAEAEVIQAARFYEARVASLGSQFLDALDAAITEILAAPDRWRIVRGDKRRYLMRRFPYGIYYRIAGDNLHVLVVKHHHQHPDHGVQRS